MIPSLFIDCQILISPVWETQRKQVTVGSGLYCLFYPKDIDQIFWVVKLLWTINIFPVVDNTLNNQILDS